VTPLPVDTQTLWFVTRAAGLVSIGLLSLTVALGIVSTSRHAYGPRWPRFLSQGLHRNVSLIAVALLAVHIGTAVADDYVAIRLRDVVVPVGGLYRPVWLGGGAVAVDVLALVIVTSLLRLHLGYRTWRLLHWTGYGCWAVAVVHGLGTGSDARRGWALSLQVACVAVVLVAVMARLGEDWRSHTVVRVCGAAAVVLLVAVVARWADGGPLAPGWAHRSGTPPPRAAPHLPAAGER
jgi:predicted ferric reductase